MNGTPRNNKLNEYDYINDLRRISSNKIPQTIDTINEKISSAKTGSISGRSDAEKQTLLNLLIAVCFLVFVAYFPVLSARALTFDDEQYLTKNPLVQNPGWTSVKRFLTEVGEPSKAGYYQPLTMISLMTDRALGGRKHNLMPFHRTNLALHVANTGLIMVLFYLLFGCAWIAAAVALLFGVHPLTVEPVAWLSERTTLLSSFFALGCLNIYVLYAKSSNWKLFVLCMAAYILALMSKPSCVSLPMLMLIIDSWPLRRWKRQLILEKVPFLIIGGICVLVIVVSRGHNVEHPLTIPDRHYFMQVPLLICHNIIFYIHKIVLPINLTPYYPFPEKIELSNPMMLAGVVGTCILSAFLIFSLRWTRAVLMGAMFFIVAILPTMQIIRFSSTIAADKYVYLAFVGLLMILVAFLCWFCGNSGTDMRKLRRTAVVVVMLMFACAEVFATRQYLPRWNDSESIYEHMLTLSPDVSIVHYNLGIVLKEQGKFDEAITHYRRVLQIDPNHGKAHNNLGIVLRGQGKFDEAIIHYRRALQINPNNAEAYNNLGVVLEGRDKLDEAIACYQQALQIKPHLLGPHTNLGRALQLQNKLDEALDHCRQDLENVPDFAEAHANMGYILQLQGKLDEAIEHYNQALRSKPYLLKALNSLAWLLSANPDANTRNTDKAVRLAEHAAVLTKYRSVEVLDILAVAYASAGQFDHAVTIAQTAFSLACTNNDSELADQISRRLELYRQSKPYRDERK